MKSARLFVAFFLVVMTMSLVACASTGTKVDQTWKSPAFTQAPLNNILIVGMNEDDAAKRTFEGIFVDQFKQADVNAASGAVVLPRGQKLTKEVVRDFAMSHNMKYVLVTDLVAIDDQTRYVSPATEASPVQFGQYYITLSTKVKTPGYYTGKKYFHLETRIFDVNSETLVWSASTTTVEPGSKEKGVKSMCSQIIKSLKADKMI